VCGHSLTVTLLADVHCGCCLRLKPASAAAFVLEASADTERATLCIDYKLKPWKFDKFTSENLKSSRPCAFYQLNYEVRMLTILRNSVYYLISRHTTPNRYTKIRSFCAIFKAKFSFLSLVFNF